MKASRPAACALAAQILLTACTATAHSPQVWPEPRPPAPQQQPFARSYPNFQAPSATDCRRPVALREEPGHAGPQHRPPPPPLHDHHAARESALADSAAAGRSRHEKSSAERRAHAESATPAPAAAAAPQLQRSAPAHDGVPQPPQQPRELQRQHPVVTAGVVDDNADFREYLAFRQRTHVAHRPRDVRERYLLEVKDARGRGIADAEVAVQAPSGHAMWARTDGAGRAWLHPNAFDPWRSSHYDVLVRKDGRQAMTQLVRGQKSAVEAVLEARPADARARLDLVFLIDATGSMADEIDKLKATLRTITAEVAALPTRPDICLGLVAYRDRGDAFLLRAHDFTDDVGDFLRQALLPLRAGGGGDYAEAMNEALHETVHQLSWRGDGATRMVILLADAPPHLDYGAPHYDEDMLAALGKGIKIFGVGASGLDKQGEYIQRQMAQYTGGKFVFLTYADARHPASGPGRDTVHDVKNYSVDTLDRLVVRLVAEELAKRDAGR